MMKKKFILILCLIILVIGVERIVSITTPLDDRLELMTYDLRAKLAVDKGPFARHFKHADKKIVIIAIDNYSKKELEKHPELNFGPWPWPRDTWINAVNFIEQGEPKAVLFDVVYSNLDGNHWNDRRFAQTLRRYDNIVMGTALSNPKSLADKKETIPEVESNEYLPTAEPLDIKIDDQKLDDAITYYSHEPVHDMYAEYNTMGVVNKELDPDSVVRRAQPIYKLIKGDESYYMPSLAFAGFLKYMGEDGKITVTKNQIKYKGMVIPINKNGETYINWHGMGRNYTYIPISRVLLSANGEGQLKSEFFKDKIVIIGKTTNSSNIELSSVKSSYAGPEATATALDNFINDTDAHNRRARKFITVAPKFLEYGLIFIFCTAIVLLGVFAKNAMIGIINSFASICLYVLFCFWIFTNPAVRIWVPIVVPLYYLSMASGIVFAFRFQKESAKKASVMNMFGKFVSPKVLTTLLKNPDNLNLKSTRKPITIMFCDVKDFTTLSEKCNPEQLVDNLNELFNVIVNVIFANNGTVDKFIGDCVMAYWGEPIAHEDDAYMAVKTALEIKQKVNELKIKNAEEDKIIFDVKIGINTGEALLGLAGSDKIMSYTAMGDAVNVAARLESNCTQQERDILITKSTYDAAKDKIVVLEAGKISVKGKAEEIEIFEPIGLVENIESPAESEHEIKSEND